MIGFIKYFIFEWRNYPLHIAWCEHFKMRYPEEYEKMKQSDLERGIKPYKNRFDFAFRNAKLIACDCRYSKDCRRYGGFCDLCNRKEGKALDNIKHFDK